MPPHPQNVHFLYKLCKLLLPSANHTSPHHHHTHKKLQKLRGTLLHTDAYSLNIISVWEPTKDVTAMWILFGLFWGFFFHSPIAFPWHLDHLDN